MFFRKCCGGKILGLSVWGIGLLLILTVMPYKWFWIVFIGIRADCAGLVHNYRVLNGGVGG